MRGLDVSHRHRWATPAEHTKGDLAASLYVLHKSRRSACNRAAISHQCRHVCPTVCVTRWWVGRDHAILTEPTSSHTNCLKTRRLPPVGCTLCWAGGFCMILLFCVFATSVWRTALMHQYRHEDTLRTWSWT